MSTYNGSYQATLSPTLSAATTEPFSQNLLASSISSLSSTTTRQSSTISKTYRQASTLFLTRRLPEALTTLLPLISPPGSADDGEPAPVSGSSRTTRIKVWSLYLTILNAIIEMEPEEGKDAFGNQEWRGLCNKVRDGDIWEEVVSNGYHGVEGDVDSDVVINLATLLLAHARDQTLNQKRLETFLASSNSPHFNLDGKLTGSPAPSPRMGGNRYRSPAKGTSGADTPRDLNARVKILELYTLHVLLRNNEWDYAREFISVSSVLDEERREAFLQALQSLQEEQLEEERLVLEERQRQEDQLRKDIAEAKRLKAENDERERRRLEEERTRRETSEIDFGVDQSTSSSSASSKSRQTKPTSHGSRPTRSSISRPNGKAATPAGPLTISARATIILSRLRTAIHQIAVSLDSNPALVMKLLAFIAGLIVMFGTKSIRERIQRIMGASWGKVKATAGMGTKVSYI